MSGWRSSTTTQRGAGGARRLLGRGGDADRRGRGPDPLRRTPARSTPQGSSWTRWASPASVLPARRQPPPKQARCSGRAAASRSTAPRCSRSSAAWTALLRLPGGRGPRLAGPRGGLGAVYEPAPSPPTGARRAPARARREVLARGPQPHVAAGAQHDRRASSRAPAGDPPLRPRLRRLRRVDRPHAGAPAGPARRAAGWRAMRARAPRRREVALSSPARAGSARCASTTPTARPVRARARRRQEAQRAAIRDRAPAVARRAA